MAIMDETGEENDGQRSAVVFNKYADTAVEESALSHPSTSIGESQHEQGNRDREERRFPSSLFPLSGDYLNALLKIDEGGVEAEDVAGESGYIGQGVG
jgi:hypothetical protein